MPNDVRDPESWYDFGAKDLDRARRRLVEEDVEDAVFHLQQAAEKLIKGKLIALGWSLQKTHNLRKLVEYLADHNVDISWFIESAELLTAGYIADRYPGFSENPMTADMLQTPLMDVARLLREISGRSLPPPV